MKENKTPEQWADELPDGYKELFLKNINREYRLFLEYPENLSEAIDYSFNWDYTDEKEDFWLDLFSWASYPDKNPLPPLPQNQSNN